MAVDTLPAALGPSERAALRDLVAFVRERFGSRLRELRLFGSRARGEGHEESDLDVLVVVDGLTGPERAAVLAHGGRLLDAHDVMVSPLPLTSDRWEELRAGNRLLAREIERDGVRL